MWNLDTLCQGSSRCLPNVHCPLTPQWFGSPLGHSSAIGRSAWWSRRPFLIDWILRALFITDFDGGRSSSSSLSPHQPPPSIQPPSLCIAAYCCNSYPSSRLRQRPNIVHIWRVVELRGNPRGSWHCRSMPRAACHRRSRRPSGRAEYPRHRR